MSRFKRDKFFPSIKQKKRKMSCNPSIVFLVLIEARFSIIQQISIFLPVRGGRFVDMETFQISIPVVAEYLCFHLSPVYLKYPILQTHITFVTFSARRSFAVQIIDRYFYSNPLIAGVVIFILISMLIAAVALYRNVYESESCANLQPVKLLNYLRY